MSVFPQIEKLKNNALIDRVFKEGRRVQSGYLAMHYLKSEETGGVIFINVSVSKKEVCLAVNRNKIKRKYVNKYSTIDEDENNEIGYSPTVHIQNEAEEKPVMYIHTSRV